jgi:cellulose synthase operon protein C
VVCAPREPSRPAVTAAQSQGNVQGSNADLLAKSIPPASESKEPGAIVPGGPVLQRDKTEPEVSNPDAPYSGWVGASGYGLYRAGASGIDSLVDIENTYEASVVFGKTVRLTVVPRAVYLHSGTIDTAAFRNKNGRVIPVLGTLPANALVAPQQQFASGLGGELQLTTANVGLAVGYTPYNFLVSNITGHAQWRPLGGHVTVFADRDSVKDTQLSYAGLRDPGTITPLYSGKIWGGVIATGGGARFDASNERARIYIAGGGSKITGYHVLDNRSFNGSMAASFRVRRWPGHGSLSTGVSLFGMHYDHNERGMTYGRGGYFSPNSYFQAGVPLIYEGYHGKSFNYVVNGSVGVHTFQEERAPYYPLDLPLQTGSGNAFYPQTSITSADYSIDSEGAYRVANNWYIGGFLAANNTRNYNMVSGGFFVRYLFKPQIYAESAPKGFFPANTGFRPLRVP